MPKLVILGSSNAIPDLDHENTHMALVAGDRFVLIDCVGSPVVRLKQAGLEITRISDLILTHFHPDHVSGVPSLLMASWLLGRTEPLAIYGLAHTLDRIEKLMNDYDWKNWPNFYQVKFFRVPEEELSLLFEDKGLRILTSPVRHLIPTLGIRVEFLETGRVLAYSCDTEPCQAVINLAGGADVLLHEATGASLGHSSAAQAGTIARQAEASQLYLIHYPTGDFAIDGLENEARENYHGPVTLAEDFLEIQF